MAKFRAVAKVELGAKPSALRAQLREGLKDVIHEMLVNGFSFTDVEGEVEGALDEAYLESRRV